MLFVIVGFCSDFLRTISNCVCLLWRLILFRSKSHFDESATPITVVFYASRVLDEKTVNIISDLFTSKCWHFSDANLYNNYNNCLSEDADITGKGLSNLTSLNCIVFWPRKKSLQRHFNDFVLITEVKNVTFKWFLLYLFYIISWFNWSIEYIFKYKHLTWWVMIIFHIHLKGKKAVDGGQRFSKWSINNTKSTLFFLIKWFFIHITGS